MLEIYLIPMQEVFYTPVKKLEEARRFLIIPRQTQNFLFRHSASDDIPFPAWVPHTRTLHTNTNTNTHTRNLYDNVEKETIDFDKSKNFQILYIKLHIISLHMWHTQEISGTWNIPSHCKKYSIPLALHAIKANRLFWSCDCPIPFMCGASAS